MKRTDKYKDSTNMMNNIANVTDKARMDVRVMNDAKVKKHTIVTIHVIEMMIRDIVMMTIDIKMIMIIVGLSPT